MFVQTLVMRHYYKEGQSEWERMYVHDRFADSELLSLAHKFQVAVFLRAHKQC